MTTTPWMAYAWAELGVHETPGPQCTARIAAYLASVHQPSQDEIPWCAAFVGWCLQQAELPVTGSASSLSWAAWGMESAVPCYGDVVVFTRPPDPTHGHVAFLVDILPTGEYLVLGGNQSDAVSVTRFPQSRVKNLRRPPTVPRV